jgi:hypothetical protein
MSSTGAMTLPELEAPHQPPPRRRARKITVDGQYPAPAAQGRGDPSVVSAYTSSTPAA